MICAKDDVIFSRLARKCLRTQAPCGGHTCSCALLQVCYDCLVEALFVSPKSQRALGRWRANCAFCKAEYCHWDVVLVREDAKKKNQQQQKQKTKGGANNSKPNVGGGGGGKNDRLLFLQRQGTPEYLDTVRKWVSEDDSLVARVHRFAFTGAVDAQLRLPAELSTEDRRMCHAIAEALGLTHESVGEGAERALVLGVPAVLEPRIEDWIAYKNGFIGLFGVSVECAAYSALRVLNAEEIPLAYQEERWKRDGKEHHITLVSPPDLEVAAQARGIEAAKRKIPKEFVLELIMLFHAAVKNDWTVVGVGVIGDDKNNRAIYVVIDWPSANAWREQQGLKKATFHITLGFMAHDVHDVSKDATTVFKRL